MSVIRFVMVCHSRTGSAMLGDGARRHSVTHHTQAANLEALKVTLQRVCAAPQFPLFLADGAPHVMMCIVFEVSDAPQHRCGACDTQFRPSAKRMREGTHLYDGIRTSRLQQQAAHLNNIYIYI